MDPISNLSEESVANALHNLLKSGCHMYDSFYHLIPEDASLVSKGDKRIEWLLDNSTEYEPTTDDKIQVMSHSDLEPLVRNGIANAKYFHIPTDCTDTELLLLKYAILREAVRNGELIERYLDTFRKHYTHRDVLQLANYFMIDWAMPYYLGISRQDMKNASLLTHVANLPSEDALELTRKRNRDRLHADAKELATIKGCSNYELCQLPTEEDAWEYSPDEVVTHSFVKDGVLVIQPYLLSDLSHEDKFTGTDDLVPIKDEVLREHKRLVSAVSKPVKLRDFLDDPVALVKSLAGCERLSFLDRMLSMLSQ